MNFSAYAIRNPLFSIVIFILLTVVGAFSFSQMKIQQFPDIDFPMIAVSVILPGAAPAQLENDVAKFIEDKVANVQGVKGIRTILQSGVATLMIEFELEKPLQEALDDVRSAVDAVRGDLPAAAHEPIISKSSISGLPIVIYTVANDDMDAAALSWYVDNDIKKLLSGIEGVGSIERVGGVKRQIQVLVDALKLQSVAMAITDLSEKIKNLQQDAPAGEAAIGTAKQPINAIAALEKASDLRDVQIEIANSSPLRLGDIATIADTFAPRDTMALLDGKEVVGFSITRSRGASEVAVAKRVAQAIDELVAANPKLRIQKVYDLAQPVADDYRASMQMLFEGGLLAVVVILIFLRNVRATLIAATALPLSIIPAFAGMYLLGFSINVISLLALSLVVGVLVDDAIVEIENIMRHLRLGKTPYQAAMEAADEIGLAVIATTFTLIAVFLPTAFMSGIIGQFFKQFGWTASIAIFTSLLVARLLTPMMAAYLLRVDNKVAKTDGFLMRGYLKLVKITIRWRWITLLVTAAIFMAALTLIPHISKTFIPDDDFSQSRVQIELAPGATLQDTYQVSENARLAIANIAGVKRVYTAIGATQMELEKDSGGGGEVRKATLNIVLDERGTRAAKTTIERQISAAMQTVAGARFRVGLSNGGEQNYKIALTSDYPQTLQQAAQNLVNDLRKLPEAINVSSDAGLVREELKIYPDYLKMAERGVTTAAIARTIRVATIGDYEQLLSKLNFDQRQIPIVVKLSAKARGDIASLANLQVMGSFGAVRLGDVATLKFASGESTIKRYQRKRTVTITAEPRAAMGDLISAARKVDALQNLSKRVTALEQGQAENMGELFFGFAVAMIIGILCVYGVLVLLFGRVLHPFTILMALPLSLGGAFIGLLLAKSSLSMPSLIGLIMLMGIATKNSILLVDYAIIATERDHKPRLDAIIDACQKRARPIIMTTIAMGAGMLPLIIGWGGGDISFRRPMAVAVFGGLMTSTILSLILIPTVYTIIDDISIFFRRKNKPHAVKV